MNKIVFLVMFLMPFAGCAQKSKKVVIKNGDADIKEIFYVLNSDNSIRHGSYEREINGQLMVQGYYENNQKAGQWKYYDWHGKLAHVFDMQTNELTIKTDEEQKLNLDSANISKKPICLGGISALYYQINVFLRYPAFARRNGIEGKVYVSFTVNENGEMVDFKIKEGVEKGLNEEALRVFKLVNQHWLPALDANAEPTSSEITLPITFILG